MRNFVRKIRLLFSESNANVTFVAALALPVLAGLSGGAVDYVTATKFKAQIQAAADAGALAGASEISLAVKNATTVKEMASLSVKQVLAGKATAKLPYKTAVNVAGDKSSIQVDVSLSWKPMFMGMISPSFSTISATAIAKIMGTGNICVMGLSPGRNKTVHMERRAKLIGNGCGIYSKSTATNSIDVADAAHIEASFICSEGGIKQNSSSQVTPAGVQDCPTPPDPLAGRIKPEVGGCDFKRTRLRYFHGTLRPGVYCQGLSIGRYSNVTLAPGIYIIKDGGLTVTGGSVLTGDNVGVYLTGKNARFAFLTLSTIKLKAPISGPMAGLLFFQDPEAPGVGDKLNSFSKNIIATTNAEILEGTIYLPKGRLEISGKDAVAQNSAYTAIVTSLLELREGPTLVLNADYASTNVPVPDGLAGGQVVLAK